jgi:hypothetical protein
VLYFFWLEFFFGLMQGSPLGQISPIDFWELVDGIFFQNKKPRNNPWLKALFF